MAFKHQRWGKATKKGKDLPPMDLTLSVNIKSGHIVWDSLSENVGYVYDQSCYDQDDVRVRKQGEQVALTIIGSHREQVVEFDKDTYCESCFQHRRGEQELRIKGKEIYCPHCGVRRPFNWEDGPISH